jgi:hypothetical protein
MYVYVVFTKYVSKIFYNKLYLRDYELLYAFGQGINYDYDNIIRAAS